LGGDDLATEAFATGPLGLLGAVDFGAAAAWGRPATATAGLLADEADAAAGACVARGARGAGAVRGPADAVSPPAAGRLAWEPVRGDWLRGAPAAVVLARC
jgi:hypothetical protein